MLRAVPGNDKALHIVCTCLHYFQLLLEAKLGLFISKALCTSLNRRWPQCCPALRRRSGLWYSLSLLAPPRPGCQSKENETLGSRVVEAC